METVSIDHLKELLLFERVRFQYKKLDGTLREAHGTRQFAYIPENMHPADTSTYFETKNVRYFDLEKGEWRSIGKDVKEVVVL